jgi:hypothetical protein
MNIPFDVIKCIYDFIPLHNRLLLPLNKEFNNINKKLLNKNIIIIQRFIKNTKIPRNIINILDDDFGTYHDINEKMLKRYYIRYYPHEFIKSNIKLSVKKIPNLDNNKEEQLKSLVELMDNPNINYNYFINKYINILTIDEICYVGF